MCSRFPGLRHLIWQRLLDDPGDGTAVADVACLRELQLAKATLEATTGPLPSWTDILQGARPRPLGEDDTDPCELHGGWQLTASSVLENAARTAIETSWPQDDVARLRSCSGRNNARWLTTAPTSEQTKLDNPMAQCLLRRRLGLPILAGGDICEATTCQRPLDAFGHHRTACMRTGRVHARHSTAISPWRQVLNEAGYRVHTERLIRNTHLAVHHDDQRRMDLVAAPGARGLGARRGVCLFCDLTIVSPLRQDGHSGRGSARRDGAALQQAVARKQRTYADISATGAAALIVLGCEVYGRWCNDALQLINELAALKAREAPRYLRRSAKAAWSNRWWGIVGVGVQRAIAEALLCTSSPDLLPAGVPPADEPQLMDVLDIHQ